MAGRNAFPSLKLRACLPVIFPPSSLSEPGKPKTVYELVETGEHKRAAAPPSR